MTYGAYRNSGFKAGNRRSSQKHSSQNTLGTVGLSAIALACGWILYGNLGADDASTIAAAVPPAAEAVGSLAAPGSSANSRVASTYGVLHDYAYVALLTPKTSAAPATFEKRFAMRTDDESAAPTGTLNSSDVALLSPKEVVESVPMPTRRPSELRIAQTRGPSPRDVAQANKSVELADNKSVATTIFEKLFGKSPASGTTLAYAAPDGGVFSNGESATPGKTTGLYDQQTAVYDISAHVVYMPNGTKLEAHSGLGSMLDNPHHVSVRMRGPTPPHTYDLTLRESLFHGVQAIRLNPIGGEGNIYGRTGLLAHTYMLGPNGDSNGCVSFKNYDAFLRAYLNHEVKRLVVVASL